MKKNLTPRALLKQWSARYPAWRRLFAGTLLVAGILFILTLSLFAGHLYGKAETARQTTAPTEDEINALLGAVPQAAFGRHDTLTVGTDDAFEIINPLFSSGDGELDAVDLIYEPLVRIGKDGLPSAILAESWELHLTEHILVFHLRKDHTFTDGRIVTAADVIYTYRCLLSDSYDGPLRGRLDQVAGIATVQEAGLDEMDGDSTVVFTLADWVEEPDFRQFSIGILKSDACPYDPDQIFKMRNDNPYPQGSGSYVLSSMSGDEAILVRRSGYGGIIRRITLRTVSSEDKYGLLLRGELDIVRNLWDSRMKQRADDLKGYSFYPFSTSVDSYFLVNPKPIPANIIQLPSQRLAILMTAAGETLSGLQQTSLVEIYGARLTLYYFQGIDDVVSEQNRGKASGIAGKLAAAGLNVKIQAIDWPDLVQRTIDGTYDILLLPATANSRLPDHTVILKNPARPDASAWITGTISEVYIVSNRLAQLTVNTRGHPFAAAAGSWTDRIENIMIYNPDGTFWEP